MDSQPENKKKGLGAIRQNAVAMWAQFLDWLAGFSLRAGWTRGVMWAIGLLVVISAGFTGASLYTGFGRWLDILISVILAALVYLILLLVGPPILKLLLKIPVVIWVVLAAGVVALIYFWEDYNWLNWVLIAASLLGGLLLGASIYELVRGGWRTAVLRKKIFISVMMILGAGIFIIQAVLFFSPGTPAEKLVVQIPLDSSSIDAPNPSEPGPYNVELLTYGSGADRWRPEYGEEADLVTETVSTSPYVSYSGWKAELREWFWGFSPSETPVNGRVWVPEGAGPFPLVLIVHGNHAMTDYSDPGYAYLGELLASRGFITVSVDQNFFNGGIYGKSSNENDARAWLLLKHIEVWQDWNNDPGSQFYGLVDLENIALIGHSRGGEAVALAAVFNQLSRYPNNANIRWDFNYGIRAVAAIAPVDQQYQPADHPAEMLDVSYLVLQGSHDSDLHNYSGFQQFQRATFSSTDSNAFAAGVYIYRANHGQFNTIWGDRDASGIKGQMLNRRALLTAEEQRQAARLYISAFLETNLHGEQAYRTIFQDYRRAGDWLPQTGYITQYKDSGTILAASFEEDYDVTTTTMPGGRVQTSGSLSWNEQQMRFRNKKRQDNHVVRLRWSGSSGEYRINLPTSQVREWALTEEAVLVFTAADGREPADLQAGLDFSIVLTDRNGEEASVLASEVLPLQTQFPAQISKLPPWNEHFYKTISEAVLQSYRVPLTRFMVQNPDLDLANLASIIFRFDQPPSGMIYLDEIGFDLVP